MPVLKLSDYDPTEHPYLEAALRERGVEGDDDTVITPDVQDRAGEILAEDDAERAAEAADDGDGDGLEEEDPTADPFKDIDDETKHHAEYFAQVIADRQAEVTAEVEVARAKAARHAEINRGLSSHNPAEVERANAMRVEDCEAKAEARMIGMGMLTADGFENEQYASALESGATAQDDEDHDPDATDGTELFDAHPTAERNAAARIRDMEARDQETMDE